MDGILIEALVKNYHPSSRLKEPIRALQGLNLKVAKGDIFGFIGPNGAGKTTAIKVLVGLIMPTSGKAVIFGEPAGSLEARRQFGYLSEISYYYPFMAAGELLDYYGRLFELDEKTRRSRIDLVLEEVGLLKWKDQRLSDFSKGMQQRFGIAQALISDPPLLILDEPTSGLDPIGQKEVKDIILRLKEKGYTIFFSSHKLTEVENICDHIGIINRGRMLISDKLENLLPPGHPADALENLFFDLINKDREGK